MTLTKEDINNLISAFEKKFPTTEVINNEFRSIESRFDTQMQEIKKEIAKNTREQNEFVDRIISEQTAIIKNEFPSLQAFEELKTEVIDLEDRVEELEMIIAELRQNR